jgi:hypothetical protein
MSHLGGKNSRIGSGVGYDRRLALATAIHRMPFTESTSQAHMEASKAMIDQADELYAVWDGHTAQNVAASKIG